MSDYVIQAEGLGKRYFLGEDSTSLRFKQALHAIAPNWMLPSRDELWALKDASFNIGAGEAIGVIGGNGAGKSTLLKVLSRITPPTAGHATVRGRVGTLLEVGTGFHPELSGRDNIALSGSILGMRPEEVARKFDQIVQFAELEKFLDTPVKRYSSGMYCRLAFGVAAFLDPEILIVDEVLAVGDAGFQRKSLGRLSEATEKEGRTVLFVSHNFQAVRNFCRRVIVLRHGQIIYDGPTEQGLELYLKGIPKTLDLRGAAGRNRSNRTSGAVRFTSMGCFDSLGQPRWQFRAGEIVNVRLGYEAHEPVSDLSVILRLASANNGEIITTIRETVSDAPLSKGQRGVIEISLPNLSLRAMELTVSAFLAYVDSRVFFDVIDSNVDMPFLQITSDEDDPYRREGIYSPDYLLRNLSDD